MTWWKRDCDVLCGVSDLWFTVGMMTWWKRDCDTIPTIVADVHYCRNDDLMKKGLRRPFPLLIKLPCLRRNDDLMKKGLRPDTLRDSSLLVCRNDDLMKKGLRRYFTAVAISLTSVGMMTWWKRDCDTRSMIPQWYSYVGMMTWWKRDCDYQLWIIVVRRLV